MLPVVPDPVLPVPPVTVVEAIASDTVDPAVTVTVETTVVEPSVPVTGKFVLTETVELIPIVVPMDSVNPVVSELVVDT